MKSRINRREQKLESKKMNILIGFMITIILLRIFIAFIVKIPSESMMPTLNINDRLIATKVYNPEKLKRGDIIIFYSKEEEELMIKRLIGVPGDRIFIDKGVVSVNDNQINEEYIKEKDEFTGEYKVPRGEYFLLGDNRKKSYDSRKWRNPFIKGEDIKGKAIIKIYPFKNFGVLK
ncbi:TPA: signal peptidase I [Clostridioides difficile]|nr:signal peptidase I [Clostridioides difficile]